MATDQPTARIPPHSAGAEHAVLGIILLEGIKILPKVAGVLQTDDFYFEEHRTIFQTMLTMGAEGLPVDVVTLAERLAIDGTLHVAGGAARLALLLQQGALCVGENLPTYLDIVRSHAVRRTMIQQATDLINDAFEAHKTALDLVESTRSTIDALATRAAPPLEVFKAYSYAELLALALEAPEFHVLNYIPTKGITFIVGDSEAFKSWFAMYIGLCKATGRLLFDIIPVRPGAVLLISEENGIVEDRRRLDLLGRGMGFEPGAVPFYIAPETSFSFDDPARYAALRAFVAEHQVELVIVDSFIRVHRRKEADSGDMNALYMDRMKPLIRDGVDLVLLHHKRKLPAGLHGAQLAQASSDNDDIRGSGDLRAAAHAVLFLKTQSKTHVVVRQNKARGFKKQDPFVFSLMDTDGDGIVLKHEGKPEDTLDKTAACKAAILEYASEHPPGFFQQDVIAGLKGKFSKRIIIPTLKAMSEKEYPLKADEVPQGRTKKKFYVLVSADPDPDEGGDVDVPF